MIHHVTPLLPSPALSGRSGAEVWLKMEALQPTGSFKLRGMGNACRKAVERGARRLLTSSGGNAGLAVAYAARQLGVPVTVVVPRRTDRRMRDLIAEQGATVEVCGEVWDDAHAHALELAGDAHTALIHPFDHRDVWEGHATLVDEVLERVVPDAVVVAVGGGGLLAGVVQGLRARGLDEVPVIAAETVGAASFAAAVRAGRPVTLPSIDSIALTLGARTVCERAVELAKVHPILPWQCADEAALDACELFLDDHRVLVEPACGAALAAVGSAPHTGDGVVLVVVCGGAGVTVERLRTWRTG